MKFWQIVVIAVIIYFIYTQIYKKSSLGMTDEEKRITEMEREAFERRKAETQSKWYSSQTNYCYGGAVTSSRIGACLQKRDMLGATIDWEQMQIGIDEKDLTYWNSTALYKHFPPDFY